MMDALIKDIRHGIRTLVKRPGFTAIAVITLALGIGANTAIFSVVNAVLLRPFPYPESDKLIRLWESNLQRGNQEAVTAGNFLDWRRQNQSFADLAAYRYNFFNLTGSDRPESIRGIITNTSLFSILGTKPIKGRTLLREDEANGNSRVAVIGYGLWNRLFGGADNVIGRTLTLNGKDVIVVGVMPREFDFPGEAELWMPPDGPVPAHVLRPKTDMSQDRGSAYLDAIGRLRSGVSLEQARTDLQRVASGLAQQYPDSNQGRGVKLVSLREQLVGDVRRPLLVLFGAVALVLLMAGANVANLLMTHAATRQKELAIRRALGASRAQLIRQLLTESLLLSVFGGVCGLLLALWGTRPLVSLVPSGVHGLKEISIDTPVLLFTGGLSVLIGIAFGLLPALQSSSVDANESLKESGRGSGAATASNRARSFLIVAEVSLSLILLVGAGLMVKSYVRLQQVDPGFQVDAVQTMKLTLPATRYPEEPQQADFFHQLIDRLKSEPGVSAAAAISRLPLTQGNSDRSLEIDGHPTSDAQGGPLADYRAVSADYFQVVGIRLLAGRDFTEHDDARTPGTAVINETLARLAFPGEEPIGKRLRVDGDQEWLEVIGVCADIKHFGLDAPTHAELYVSYLKFPWPFMTVVARGRGDDAALSNAMRQAVWSIDRDEPVPEIVPMRDLLSRTLAVRRLNMLMMALFGGLALLLATVGIYGVISYSVTQRTHEIGLRIALGARTMDVLKMVVGNGMTLAIVGTAIGLVGAFALTRLMSSLLFAVTPTDLTTFVVVSSGLLIVAFFACFVPARRAAKVDPLISLRYE